MKETIFPLLPHLSSPAGALVRLLIDGEKGSMIHSTLPPRQINKPVVHSTVFEFWHVLEGHGEIWRRDQNAEKITTLKPGVSIDITPGTAFQYRNVSAERELKFICVTMPPWPGPEEATYVMTAPWVPTV